MYRFPEDSFLDSIAAKLPDAGYEGRVQFAQMLPMLSLFSGVITLGIFGWPGVTSLWAAATIGAVFPAVVAALLLAPAVLWLAAFFQIRRGTRQGWRLFAVAAALATLGSIITLQIFSLAFNLLFLYAALQSRHAYQR